MSTTPDLGLPLLVSLQSQPDVTHNEALILLQAMLGGAKTITNTPAGSPADGDVYICGAAPTGAWAGKANKIAIRYGGAWRFVPNVDSAGGDIAIGVRQEGLRMWVQDVGQIHVWSGTAWVAKHSLAAGTQAAIADAVGGDEVAKINAILAALRTVGIVAP